MLLLSLSISLGLVYSNISIGFANHENKEGLPNGIANKAEKVWIQMAPCAIFPSSPFQS